MQYNEKSVNLQENQKNWSKVVKRTTTGHINAIDHSKDRKLKTLDNTHKYRN